MAIRFKYGGVSYTADTPQEAADTMALLKEREADIAHKRAQSRVLAKFGGPMEQIKAFVSGEAETPWTPEVFLSFIDRLGGAQQTALAALVKGRRVPDDELRKTLKVSGNQALAGVLSGITKQAAALNIDARDIFTFENLRSAGKRRSTYAASDKFLEIASRMDWPGPQYSSKN